jgi:hypothetical protein
MYTMWTSSATHLRKPVGDALFIIWCHTWIWDGCLHDKPQLNQDTTTVSIFWVFLLEECLCDNNVTVYQLQLLAF